VRQAAGESDPGGNAMCIGPALRLSARLKIVAEYAQLGMRQAAAQKRERDERRLRVLQRTPAVQRIARRGRSASTIRGEGACFITSGGNGLGITVIGTRVEPAIASLR